VPGGEPAPNPQGEPELPDGRACGQAPGTGKAATGTDGQTDGKLEGLLEGESSPLKSSRGIFKLACAGVGGG